MSRDKQARAARRAAERARLDAMRRPTIADDHATEASIEHAARHMQVSDDSLRKLDALVRRTHTVTYSASFTRGETVPVRRDGRRTP